MFRFFKRKPENTPAAAAVPTPEAPPQADAAAAKASSWRDRLRGSLLGRQVSALLSSHPLLDEDLLEQLETTLLSADVGVKATTEVLDDLRRRMQAREFADANALFAHLRRQLVAMLRPVERPLELAEGVRPFVLLVIGVNGAGKTTTIGKLAKWMKREGLEVMLAAGDTFRAAAVEQLQTWGERNQVPVIAQGGGADSASVIYDALAAAKSRHVDVLIADTAGRLHTQAGLMDELAKVKRVIGKLDADRAARNPAGDRRQHRPKRAEPGPPVPPQRGADRPGRDQARWHRQGRRGVRAGTRGRGADPLHRCRRGHPRPARVRRRGVRRRAAAGTRRPRMKDGA